jgi:hypothetical protein
MADDSFEMSVSVPVPVSASVPVPVSVCVGSACNLINVANDS